MLKQLGITVLMSSMALSGCSPATSSNVPATPSNVVTHNDPAFNASSTVAQSPEVLASATVPRSASRPITSVVTHSRTDQSHSTSSDSTLASVPDSDWIAQGKRSAFAGEERLEAFLYDYYGLLNVRNYDQAWNLLGADMQANSPYPDYINWWDSVFRVEVKAISQSFAGEYGGIAIVQLNYGMQNGASVDEILVFNVGPDALASDLREEWRIQSVQVAGSIHPTRTRHTTPLTPHSTLVLNGIGPIRVGMTLQEAANATGFPMATWGRHHSSACDYYQAIGAPNGLSFMVNDDRIVRVDINMPTLTTRSGAGIGSSIAEIQAMYPGKIEVSGHKYVPEGHYLTFIPDDATDQQYRLLFETDENGRVTRFRSGFAEQVGYVEGCA